MSRRKSDTVFFDSTRDAYCSALIELAEKNKNIVVLEADLTKAAGTERFKKKFPERTIQLGIAEQNVIGVAAGLATMGKIPFANIFCVFASRRACDQVAISVAFPNLNVKITGLYSGFTTAKNGPTHQSLEDIAIMRAIPNMTIVIPADIKELEKAVKAVAEHVGPTYLRTVRGDMPTVYDKDYQFKLGKAIILREGNDLTIISTGIMVARALQAREMLSKEKIKAGVVNMHTIKPIDQAIIIKCARETGAIVTVENHSVIGGLGSAVSEVLAENYPVPLKRIGVRDSFGDTGSFDWLVAHYGMDAVDIKNAAKEVMQRRGGYHESSS